jgi:hypothetical protein
MLTLYAGQSLMIVKIQQSLKTMKMKMVYIHHVGDGYIWSSSGQYDIATVDDDYVFKSVGDAVNHAMKANPELCIVLFSWNN